MKEYLKTIPATTIIIIYLYLCGGLYLIIYWSTFNFDISNIASITDIPKNFIYPFILSNTTFIIGIVAAQLDSSLSKRTQDNISKERKPKKSIEPFFDRIFFISVFALIPLYTYLKYNDFFWWITGICLLFFLLFKFMKSPLIARCFPNSNIRYYAFTLFVSVPIFCVITAKSNSISIYNNTDIKYAKINNEALDSTSLKLLGFLGDKLIISSLDNKKIIVLNQSSLSVVELTQKEKK